MKNNQLYRIDIISGNWFSADQLDTDVISYTGITWDEVNTHALMALRQGCQVVVMVDDDE